MVSRDPWELSEEQVRSAAYESLSENPWTASLRPCSTMPFSALPGPPATARQTRWMRCSGHRDERERLGWFSARADDLLNFVPARLTVVLLLYFAFRGRYSPARC